MSIDDSKANAKTSTKNKTFDPKKYDMVICSSCEGNGYIQGKKRQPCPKCGGFGYVTERQAERGCWEGRKDER